MIITRQEIRDEEGNIETLLCTICGAHYRQVAGSTHICPTEQAASFSDSWLSDRFDPGQVGG